MLGEFARSVVRSLANKSDDSSVTLVLSLNLFSIQDGERQEGEPKKTARSSEEK